MKTKREGLLITITVCFGLVPYLFSSFTLVQAANLPNFLIILADDLGYGDIGVFGSETLHDPPIFTPHLDGLFTGGMRFNDFHSNGPVCGPTRAALVTGLYQNRVGQEVVMYVYEREKGMDTSTVTFAEVLRKQGYVTGLMGKWHLGLPLEFNPTNQGFDVFRGFISGNIDYLSHIDGFGYYDWWHNKEVVREEGYTTDLITSHSLDFLDTHGNGEKPFCLYIAHEAPHFPYQGRNDESFRVENPGVKDGGKGPRFETDPDAAYQEMMEALDEGVGLVMDKLEELGIDSNTLVIFTSDNGPTGAGATGGLRGNKGTLYEGGHRVPAAFYWPGQIEAGTVAEEVALTMDIFPTLMYFAGVEVTGLDGVDLSGLLLNQTRLPERTLVWDYQGDQAVRRGDYKLNIQDGTLTLYDVKKDRDESDNIAGENRNLRDELEQYYLDWKEDIKNEPDVQYVSVKRSGKAISISDFHYGIDLENSRVFGIRSGEKFDMNGRRFPVPEVP